MWEAIEINRRRSWLLVLVMAALLLGLGTLIAAAFDPGAWWIGTLAASVTFAGLLATAAIGGDRLLLHGAGARRVEAKMEFPKLWNVVDEMTIAAGLPAMPSIWLIEDRRPNAFVTGRSPETAAVAVTTGLLERLDRDELQGVIAHEIGHVVNRDARFLTLAGVLVGSIVMLSEVFLRSFWFAGAAGRRRTAGRVGDGRLQILLFVAGTFAALVAPLLARMLYFACSRRREYLADASAARLTRYPPGLASALETIARRHSRSSRSSRASGRGAVRGHAETSRVLAPMYIVNPLAAWGSSGAFSTHPPTEKRIEILRDMAGRADYDAYESAYRRAFGKDRSCIGEVTLHADRRKVSVREPSPEAKAETTAERLRDVGDWLGRVADFALLTCACGVGIKIPPGYKKDRVHCARCGRDHAIPTAVVAASLGLATAGAEAAGATGAAATDGGSAASIAGGPVPHAPLAYRRRTDGWESFRCPKCGKNTHLSPAFEAPRIRCAGCRRHVAVLPREGSAAPAAV